MSYGNLEQELESCKKGSVEMKELNEGLRASNSMLENECSELRNRLQQRENIIESFEEAQASGENVTVDKARFESLVAKVVSMEERIDELPSKVNLESAIDYIVSSSSQKLKLVNEDIKAMLNTSEETILEKYSEN